MNTQENSKNITAGKNVIKQANIVKEFSCLGENCPDTCCQNWSMQMNDSTLSAYKEKFPELLSAVEQEADGSFVMRRDQQTRHCVKLEGGLCGIHKQYGAALLGDACYFYPRVTRALGEQIIMTASSSCPEIMRLAIEMENPFAIADYDSENSLSENPLLENTLLENPLAQSDYKQFIRLPQQIKDYLPPDMADEAAFAISNSFLNCALDNNHSPQQALAYIASVARSMCLLQQETLHQAIPVYLRLASGRLPQPAYDQADPFNLLHALCGLIVASHKPASEGLKTVIADMENALQAFIDWKDVTINLTPQSLAAAQKLIASWKNAAPLYEHSLRRFLALQISLHLFPFAGLGSNAEERISFIGIRFATVQLAIACAHLQHGELSAEQIVRIMQSISRFLDHLQDAQFSLSIYNETGWTKEERLLAIINFANREP